MGIKERKKRDVRKMRKRILTAAMQLFTKGGYENVSMRRIARQIEYSPGTIYRYFKSKNDIMLGLCYQGFEQLLTLQQELEKISDIRERLRAAGCYYVNFALENPSLYELMFATEEIIKEPDLEVESVPRRSLRKFQELVQECLEHGIFPGDDAEAVAISLWAALHGLASLLIKQQLRFMPTERMDQIVDQAFDFVFRENKPQCGQKDRP